MALSHFDRSVLKWDVVRYLRSKAVELHFTDTNQVYFKHPKCADGHADHKPRLYINKRSKLWICHKCSERGNATSLVRMLSGCSEIEATKIILKYAPVARRLSDLDDDEDEDDDEAVTPTLPEGYRKLIYPPNEKSEPYWDYLTEKRNLAPSLVQQYEMGYCRVGEYKGRVIIPINMDGELRGFVARHIRNRNPPYLNPDYVKMGEVLFNLDNVVGQRRVVLVEGVFDALRLPKMAVCTFGKKISRTQMELLHDAGFEEWVFCYDGDAYEDNLKYASRATEDVDVLVARLPEQYDPGNAPLGVLMRAIRDAKPWDATKNRFAM